MPKHISLLIITSILVFVPHSVFADGGYLSDTGTVAISADQRAIIIRNDDETSLTLSTGYTGDGGDFCWIIPVPEPPQRRDVMETGEDGEHAFEILDAYTAPVITRIYDSGCFPAGTEVLSDRGPLPIESIQPGERVRSWDITEQKWVFSEVDRGLMHRYKGDVITIHMGRHEVQATGNHPFFVLEGKGLAGRPVPQDVPDSDFISGGVGRWVEARHIETGDILMNAQSLGMAVTGMTTRNKDIDVYNLEIADTHTFTVHQLGLLVHNKNSGEDVLTEGRVVTVYDSLSLEHYEVDIVGAETGRSLLSWLQQNNYSVTTGAETVLESYIRKGWDFVAVKLNTGSRRQYHNEFLPPITIIYRDKGLVLPLYISSISTVAATSITLYVLADSTVGSYNFRIRTPDYIYLWEPFIPELHLEEYIRDLTGSNPKERSLAELYAGRFEPTNEEQSVIRSLMPKREPSFLSTSRPSLPVYVTRLECRIGPDAMTEDIHLVLNDQPHRFEFEITAEGRWWTEDMIEAAVSPGLTDLMYAVVEQDDPIILDYLLTSDEDINTRDMFGTTVLMYTARYNRNPDMISHLLQAGAGVNLQNNYGWSAVFFASENPNPEVLEILLAAGADINHQADQGETALFMMTERGQVDTVRNLLKFSPDLDARSDDGETALMAALWHQDILELLLQAGADVNARDADGRTALHRYLGRHGFYGDPDQTVVTMLLEAGADLENMDKDGGTPFGGAVTNGDTQIVSLLLKAGADPERRCRIWQWEEFQTPIAWAAGKGHADIVQILLDADIDIYATSDEGQTILMEAVDGGNPRVVRMLLDAGADVSASGEYDRTALMLSRDAEITAILLKAGAQVNARDYRGMTALGYALNRSDAEIIRILREAGGQR